MATAPSTLREYRGNVSLTNPQELIEYFAELAVQEHAPEVVPSFYLQLDGIRVFEGDDVAREEVFTGRRIPKLVPGTVDVQWSSTGNSVQQPRSKIDASQGGVHLYEGVVDIDPVQIRGENHDLFNRIFRQGKHLRLRHLYLSRDRSQEPEIGRSRPLVGDLSLVKIEVPVAKR